MKSQYREFNRTMLFGSTFFFWETTAEEKMVTSECELKKPQPTLGKMERGERDYC